MIRSGVVAVAARRAPRWEGPFFVDTGTGDILMSYDRYIAWRRLTHNGHHTREQMSLKDQTEFDALGLKEARMDAEDAAEAKRLYEAITQHSPPASDA
jgi:hypothetical protein